MMAILRERRPLGKRRAKQVAEFSVKSLPTPVLLARKASALSRSSFYRVGKRRFADDQSGATALEFALLATPLVGLILAALQMSIVFYFDQALQTLTTEAGRMLMVGSAQSAGLTQSQFQTSVCNMAPGAFACSGLMIDVESSTTYSTLNTTPLTPAYNSNGQITNTWIYNPGGPGSIVIIRLMYDWPVFGGFLGLGLANQSNGTHLLVGTAVIKNEPYQ